MPVRVLATLLVLGPLSLLGMSSAPRNAAPGRALQASLAPLVREPFLQQVSDTSAVIVWASRDAGPAEVRYRAPGEPSVAVAAVTTFFPASYTATAFDYFQHQATLTGLVPSTTYTYEVVIGGVVADSAAPDLLTTAPLKGTGTARFIAFGDSGSGDRWQRQLADLIAGESAADEWDLALHTGDVVYPKGTYQLLQDRFFKVYEGWLRRRPVFLGFGNHEAYAANGRPYLDVFALPENGANSRYPDHRERYYSFDYGPVHFIALNSEGLGTADQTQEQLTWLVRDLEATTQPWRVVFFHRPEIAPTLRPVLERYGVQLVLAGHVHTYARGVPWREGPPSSSPVVHVVTGGGGAVLNQPQPAPSLAKGAGAYHYVRVAATDCTATGTCEMTLEAVGLDGAVFDSMTLPLRSQQNDEAPPTVGWTQPAAGAVLAGTVDVAADAVDDAGVAKVDVWVDGELRLVDETAPYQWSWDTTTELNGDRILELRVIDIAGNRVASASRVVRVENPSPTLRLLSPLEKERAFTGAPYRIRWAADPGSAALTGFRVQISSDSGRTYQAVSGCAALPGDLRECVWNAPGPVSAKSLMRVTAVDALGREVSRTSPQFEVRAGTPTLLLKQPDKPMTMGLGSTQAVSWSSSLGTGASLSVEVSHDGGSSWSVLAPSLVNARPQLPWTVTGPPTTDGLVRVTALNTPLQDVSTARFTIAAPTLGLPGPSAATVWTRNTRVTVKLSSNLGLHDYVNLRLSTDGGLTFPVVLAGAVQAALGKVTITVPPLDSTSARLLVESLEHPAWRGMSPADFTIR